MGNISPHKGKLFSLWCGFKTHFANWETPIQICRISVMFLLCSPLEVSRATDARAASLTPQRGGRGGNRYHGVCDPPMVTSMVQIWTKHIDHNMDLRTLALNFRTFFAEKPTMGDAFVPRMAETCGSPHLQCLARAPFFQGLNWKIYIYTYNVYIYNNCKQPSAAAFLFFWWFQGEILKSTSSAPCRWRFAEPEAIPLEMVREVRHWYNECWDTSRFVRTGAEMLIVILLVQTGKCS